MSIVYLRVKIRSLAEEAKIIRSEERKISFEVKERHPRRTLSTEKDPVFFGLRQHRVEDVRREARASLLAYGLLRGRVYEQIERSCHEMPDISRVRDLVQKYGADRNLPIRDKAAMAKFIEEWVFGGAKLQRKAA